MDDPYNLFVKEDKKARAAMLKAHEKSLKKGGVIRRERERKSGICEFG